MISLDNFNPEIKKYNSIKNLKAFIKKVNNGEGYLSMLGKHVVFNKYLTGAPQKERDRILANNMKGIVSF